MFLVVDCSWSNVFQNEHIPCTPVTVSMLIVIWTLRASVRCIMLEDNTFPVIWSLQVYSFIIFRQTFHVSGVPRNYIDCVLKKMYSPALLWSPSVHRFTCQRWHESYKLSGLDSFNCVSKVTHFLQFFDCKFVGSKLMMEPFLQFIFS